MRMNRPSPDDVKDIIMAEQRAKIKQLEKENKELKAYKSLYVLLKERRDSQIEIQKRLRLEKKELQEENKELKKKLEEADKYVVLQKFRNREF